jgi:YD repeat-containing protein
METISKPGIRATTRTSLPSIPIPLHTARLDAAWTTQRVKWNAQAYRTTTMDADDSGSPGRTVNCLAAKAPVFGRNAGLRPAVSPVSDRLAVGVWEDGRGCRSSFPVHATQAASLPGVRKSTAPGGLALWPTGSRRYGSAEVCATRPTRFLRQLTSLTRSPGGIRRPVDKPGPIWVARGQFPFVRACKCAPGGGAALDGKGNASQPRRHRSIGEVSPPQTH